MGVNMETARYFRTSFEESGAMQVRACVRGWICLCIHTRQEGALWIDLSPWPVVVAVPCSCD